VECPRCGSKTTTALGDAGSTLAWYACPTCKHVWFVRPDDDCAPADDPDHPAE